MDSMRKDQKLLLTAAAVSLALWFIPFGHLVLYPLTLFNTHIHEMCHAAMTVMTGGQVALVTVNADTSGLTGSIGGWQLLISPAGYIGATLIGGLMILGGANPKLAKITLWILAAAFAFTMLVFLRVQNAGDLMGIISGVLWVATLGYSAWKLEGNNAIFLVQFLGIQQCLTSLSSFRDLYQVSMMEAHSDAHNMAQMTMIPPVIWTLLWAITSLCILWFCLSRSWKSKPRAKSETFQPTS